MTTKSQGTCNFIDAAIVIALSASTLYMGGYAYFEAMYIKLDVPFRMLDLTTDRLLAYGAANLLWLMLLVGLITAYAGWFPRGKPQHRLGQALFRIFENLQFPGIFRTGAILIAVSAIELVVIYQSAHLGREAAARFLEGRCPHIELQKRELETVQGCLIDMNSGNYWITPTRNGKPIAGTMMIVPKQMVLSATIQSIGKKTQRKH